MLVNFSVENFKSIKDKITLSFVADKSDKLEESYVVKLKNNLRVLKVAMILGPNASGKTNILKALRFLVKEIIVNPRSDKLDTLHYEKFKFDEDSRTAPTKFEIEIFTNGILYEYSVELTKEQILSEKLYFYSPKRALVFSREYVDSQEKIKFGSKIKISKQDLKLLQKMTLPNETIFSGYLKIDINIKEIEYFVDWCRKFPRSFISSAFPADIIALKLYNKSDNTFRKQLIELIKQADFTISEIKMEKEVFSLDDLLSQNKKEVQKKVFISTFKPLLRSLVYADNLAGVLFKKENDKTYIINYKTVHKIGDKEYELELFEESEGTRRYLGLAGVLLDTLLNDKILIIDEIASTLHPELIKHFLLTFLANSKKSQLIFTTHFREILMEKDILREDAIWFTEKKKDGSTDLFSLADFGTKTIRKVNSIYNFYKTGKLGAVPFTGDYKIEINNDKEEKTKKKS